jgi:hypothetical protein
MPSYLHSNFQYHLRTFFKAFISITKNYIHPRGPIFMIELDYETSFGRMLDPASADYNPDILSQHYVPFLNDRYEDIKKLNALYKEKNASFEAVDPPRQFDNLDIKKYPKVLDWFRFRERMLNTYLELLEDIFTSYTVEPLVFHSLYFKPGELLPAYNLVPEDRSPFLGSNVVPEGSYFDLTTKARFLKAEYGFAFATSFTCGRASANVERQEALTPVDQETSRFYLAAGLAAGFKGMNQYMFVDRDRWYGAPLHADGTISDSYKVARSFSLAISAIGLEEMDNQPEIACVANRLYGWLSMTSGNKMLEYVNNLTSDSSVGFCRDLMRLKLNYGIRENREWETLKQYKLLFLPSAEVMSARDQEAIVELAKSGVTIILCGVMPKYNEDFRDCQILANHFRIKTSTDYHIGTVTHKNGEFPTRIYGSIRSTDDSKVKKLVTSGTKTVGVASSRYKGALYLFAFDIASGGNHHKLAFVESILAAQDIKSHLYCSDPSVDVSFVMGKKKGLLFIVAPPPGELSDGLEGKRKEIIVKADLKPYGMSAAKVKLTSVLDNGEILARDASDKARESGIEVEEVVKPIKTTTKELREGMPFDIGFPDGHVYLVEKRQ